MWRSIMQEVLPSIMCKEKESLYGTIKPIKNQVSYLLRVTLTSENYTSNWV
jgi:hypothetical protein